MKTWAEEAGISPPSVTLDRDAGEGPLPRCCSRRFVSADALVQYGDLDVEKRTLVCERITPMAEADADMYLCDACREILRREQVITRAEMPAMRPLRNPDAL